MPNGRENYLMFRQKNKVLLYGIFYGILSETSMGFMPETNNAFLLLGGNLGNLLKTFARAISAIDMQAGTVVRQSSLFESEPWEMGPAEVFMNQAVEIKTELDPCSLLQALLRIESDFGRIRRTSAPESRTLDIDILLFNDTIYTKANLVIPHPRLHQRRFALMPLAQIAPEKVHPVLGKSIATLLRECIDTLHVAEISVKASENN